MSNIPSAPTTGAEQPQKSNTGLVVVVIILVVFIVIPLVVGAIIVFAILGFISDHYDDFDIKGFFSGRGDTTSEGIILSRNETSAVRNIISAVQDGSRTEKTISRRDCLYLERIASYQKSAQPSFCNSETIYVGVSLDVAQPDDGREIYRISGNYNLVVGNGVDFCGRFNFSEYLDVLYTYGSSSSRCVEGGAELKIIDTGEELEPFSEPLEVKNDSGIHVEINNKPNA